VSRASKEKEKSEKFKTRAKRNVWQWSEERRKYLSRMKEPMEASTSTDEMWDARKAGLMTIDTVMKVDG
jgi:hypothetical protein